MYKFQDKYRDNVYRATVASVEKNARPEGTHVMFREGQYCKWLPSGAVVRGKFYEGQLAYDAYTVWNYRGDGRYPSLSWQETLKNKGVKFIAKYCGLDNVISPLKWAKAIEQTNNHPHVNREATHYEYVLTDYGIQIDDYILSNWGYAR